MARVAFRENASYCKLSTSDQTQTKESTPKQKCTVFCKFWYEFRVLFTCGDCQTKFNKFCLKLAAVHLRTDNVAVFDIMDKNVFSMITFGNFSREETAKLFGTPATGSTMKVRSKK